MKTSKVILVLSALIIAGLSAAVYSKNRGKNMNRDITSENIETAEMSYRIEGAFMDYQYIQIDLKGTGKGLLAYKLYSDIGKTSSDKKVEFNSDPVQIKSLLSLYQKIDFFNFKPVDLNKDKITVTDVGTTTLYLSIGRKKRAVTYGYLDNNDAKELCSRYMNMVRGILPK